MGRADPHRRPPPPDKGQPDRARNEPGRPVGELRHQLHPRLLAPGRVPGRGAEDADGRQHGPLERRRRRGLRGPKRLHVRGARGALGHPRGRHERDELLELQPAEPLLLARRGRRVHVPGRQRLRHRRLLKRHRLLRGERLRVEEPKGRQDEGRVLHLQFRG